MIGLLRHLISPQVEWRKRLQGFQNAALTLARTCDFAILDRTWGRGRAPRLVCSLIEIQLRNKNERKAQHYLKLTISDFTALDHILSFPGQVKRKMFLLGKINAFANNL